MTVTIEAQVQKLDEHLDAFCACVASLDERDLAAAIGRWSTRDIVAHLIGWNRYVVEGSEQIRRGELPFYDLDPGENYSKVNATLIEKYPSTNREELLEDLRASAGELKRYLLSLGENEWDRDYGVRHRGNVVTIRNTVDELIDDYRHHETQIRTSARD